MTLVGTSSARKRSSLKNISSSSQAVHENSTYCGGKTRRRLHCCGTESSIDRLGYPGSQASVSGPGLVNNNFGECDLKGLSTSRREILEVQTKFETGTQLCLSVKISWRILQKEGWTSQALLYWSYTRTAWHQHSREFALWYNIKEDKGGREIWYKYKFSWPNLILSSISKVR